jgi:Na+/proline symporter
MCPRPRPQVSPLWPERAAYSALINEPRAFTSKQILFKEIFVGTLIYAVVLGFFDDHSSIVEARSYTYVFLAAIVLEMLTRVAFAAKDAIVVRLRHRDTRRATALMVFGVWFVMFTSKFVFIWAIDLVFRDAVNVNGFFGIFLVVLTVTVVHRLASWVFIRLGQSSLPDEPPRTVVKPPNEGG